LSHSPASQNNQTSFSAELIAAADRPQQIDAANSRQRDQQGANAHQESRSDLPIKSGRTACAQKGSPMNLSSLTAILAPCVIQVSCFGEPDGLEVVEAHADRRARRGASPRARLRVERELR
jgi:hypothetical protein